MFWKFLKWQLSQSFLQYSDDRRRRPSRFNRSGRPRGSGTGSLIFSIALMVILWLLAFGIIFLGTMISIPMLDNKGITWVFVALAALFAFLVDGFIGLRLVAAKLFDSKDNELLLSMPIPTWVILAGKAVVLYQRSLIVTSAIMLPFFIWNTVYHFSIYNLIINVLLFICVPLVSLTFRMLLGWIMASISARSRNKNLAGFILGIVFLGSYFLFAGGMVTKIFHMILDNIQTVDFVLSTALFYFGWIGRGSTGIAPAQGLLAILFAIFIFAIAYFILSKTFIGIVTSDKGGAKSKKSKATSSVKASKQSGIIPSLIRKELTGFAHNPNIFIYFCVGPLFLIAGIIVMIVSPNILFGWLQHAQESSPAQAAFFNGIMPVIVCAALSFCACLSNLPCVQISLEGKSFWILRSLPITAGQVMGSKLFVHFILHVPLLIILGIIGLCYMGTGSIIGNICSILMPVLLFLAL